MNERAVTRKNPPNPRDLLFMTAMLRAREPKMVTRAKLERILDAQNFEDAARVVTESGYRDVSQLSTFGVEDALSERRAEIYTEIAKTKTALVILDIFRAKYDYHNVKSLVKSMGANADATRILSSSGRVPAEVITEAFITGEREMLPHRVKLAISESVGTLSRTKNPQLSDTITDRRYYEDITELAEQSGVALALEYVKLLIDSANLRTYVRSVRTGRTPEFLQSSLFDGGNVPKELLTELEADIKNIYAKTKLAKAAEIAVGVLSGGKQTEFEREIDNAQYRLVSDVKYIAFGFEPLLSYLLSLDWEISALRMTLTGLLAGIDPSVLRERLRENNV